MDDHNRLSRSDNTEAMASQYKVGQVIEDKEGRLGTIRYIGSIHVAEGEFIGVELETEDGKNDGEVKGERYFECAPNHGLFMRPSGISAIVKQPAEDRPSSQAKAPANGKPTAPTPSRSRPSSVTMSAPRTRQSMAPPASKRVSLMAPPSSKEPSTGPSKRMSMAAPSTTSMAARRQSAIKPGPSTSTSTPASKTPTPSARKSLAGPSLTAPKTATRPAASRLSIAPSRGLGPGNAASGITSPVKSPSPVRASARPATTAPATDRDVAVSNKEIEDLQAKLRVMEKKRSEDRERLNKMEALQQERDRFQMIIEKLQTKYQPQQAEVAELKRQLQDSQSKFEQIEGIQAEHDSVLEMATLDREMAEEKAEAYRTELEAVRAKAEELELENEILKDENQEFSKDMSPEERTSKGWIQMERENSRLREALFRLRDMSQEQEAEMRDEIKSLEEDVKDFGSVKTQYEDAKVKLLESEADIEDLRQQLEAAMGAEDLIEQLTERNLALGEQLEQLRNENEDLAALTDLNDELEINHVEHEKQLQEVIDYKDSLLADAVRKVTQQDEAISDQEYTVGKFRELVTNLQADLEDMRASKEITESEAQALDNRQRAMMDLNRQLQASATSSRFKTIEMELRRLEAQEAAEHLSIVQLFLPETFQAERNSVLALLRFKRVAFKARLLQGFIKDKALAPDNSAQNTDNVYDACDAIDKLVWISSMCDRFIGSISGCSLEQFAKFEGAMYEIEPVERTLNGFVELLKKDDLRDEQVADGLQGPIAVMSHLSEVHLRYGLDSYADEVLMKTMLMQSHLEGIAAALQATRATILRAIPHAADDNEDGVNVLAAQTEDMIGYARSARVIVGKTIRSLQDMTARSLSLDPDTVGSFDENEASTDQLAAYARKVGHLVHAIVQEEGRVDPVAVGEVLTVIRRAADTSFDTSESDVFSTFSFKVRALIERLNDMNALASDLDQTHEFEKPTAPWVLRSKELQDKKLVSADAQEELIRLKHEMQERVTELRMRDQVLEEANVKIELLESRMRDAGKKVTRIAELEQQMEENRRQSKQMADEVDKQMRKALDLQAERDKWKAAAAEMQPADTGNAGTGDGVVPIASLREMDTLKEEIEYLTSSNKYLKTVARRKQAEEEAVSFAWLKESLVPSNEERDKKANERKEGYEWLERLTSLPATAKMINLQPKERKLGWQPRKMTPQWQVSEQELLALDSWPMKRGLRTMPRVEIVS